MRRRYVASTSFRRHVPTRFLRNQCQIITFLILKSDIIENSRIELRGILSFCQHLQIKLKLHLLLLYPSTWYICDFFLFHIETEGKGGWIIWGGGGGGAKGMLAPSLIFGGGACPPLFLRLCVRMRVVGIIFFSPVISFFSPALWGTTRCSMKHCLKVPLTQNNQPPF